jgi:alginate O-acetyltransferase complex protein AlgI
VIFNSLTFILFFAVVLGVYYLVPMSWRAKKWFILLASYVFYAAWNPPFVLLLMASTVIDWVVANRMASTRNHYGRRFLLLVSLVFNLGVLAFFKYGGFLLDNFAVLMHSIGIAYQPPVWSIILPIGISFYTFLTLSYTIDVYFKVMEPVDSLLDYAFFITFFPHLVAGPIIRAADFLPQVTQERRANKDQMGWGLVLMTIGLFEKTILADGFLAPFADRVYSAAAHAGFADAWLGTLAFSAQIFFDFAGYSTCAIGAALCLGFVLMDNFRYPYAAIGFSDFWQRWHISLSTWLRDYLYIPLGGNRRGAMRTRVNLMITMLLGGLWHGAAWRFVVWGGLHGSYLVVERQAKDRWGARALWTGRGARVVLALLTYAAVCLTWVFFRAPTLAAARHVSGSMLTGGHDSHLLGTLGRSIIVALTAVLLTTHWWLRDSSIEAKWQAMSPWVRATALTAMLVSLCLVSGDARAFIYFQF